MCSLPVMLCAQAATTKLDEDRRQLQEWGGRLSALTREFDDARQEVKAARTEIEGQRTLLVQQVCRSLRLQVAPSCAVQLLQQASCRFTSSYWLQDPSLFAL